MMIIGAIQNDVVKKAKLLEAEEQAYIRNRSLFLQIPALAVIIEDFYNLHRPTASDYESRRDLIRILNIIAKEDYGNQKDSPTVEPFGSFLMNMFSTESDLDLSINFNDNASVVSRTRQTKTLRRFSHKFNNLQRNGHVTKVDAILTARVPVLKVTDSGTGIECDISVENRDGIAKSQIVLMISAIDERFQKLCFMVKAWAKSQGINSSKDGTLNSLSLISLVAFHLQRRDPPILPPFSAIFKGGTDPATVKKAIPTFLNYGRRNNESLAQLFLTFLIRLESVKELWDEGLCASAYEGSWIQQKLWPKKIGCITVEDFTNRSLNLARALCASKMKKINQSIHDALLHIHAFVDGTRDRSQLSDFLFGTGQDVKVKGAGKFDSIEAKQLAASGAAKNKKKRPLEGNPSGAPQTKFDSIEAEQPTSGAANNKKKRRLEGNPNGARPGLGIRYVSLNTVDSLGNPVFSSNRTENYTGFNGLMRPAKNAMHYGNGWAPVNPLHAMPPPSAAMFQPNSPFAPSLFQIIPSPSVYYPSTMMPHPYNHNNGVPHPYPRRVNGQYNHWNHNQ